MKQIGHSPESISFDTENTSSEIDLKLEFSVNQLLDGIWCIKQNTNFLSVNKHY